MNYIEKEGLCRQYLMDHGEYHGQAFADLITATTDYICVGLEYPEDKVEALCRCGFTENEISTYLMEWYSDVVPTKEKAMDIIHKMRSFYEF